VTAQDIRTSKQKASERPALISPMVKCLWKFLRISLLAKLIWCCHLNFAI